MAGAGAEAQGGIRRIAWHAHHVLDDGDSIETDLTERAHMYFVAERTRRMGILDDRTCASLPRRSGNVSGTAPITESGESAFRASDSDSS